jgi:GrpB-like predicted nucleotidyltransferase (UPF0157 family)
MVADEPIVVVPYDTRWPEEFQRIAGRLRSLLGPVATRIDHVGSTAVPGLAAKPVIDIQVSVASIEPELAFVGPLETYGLHYQRENPDRTKRFFLGRDGERRFHVHVRREGSIDEQLNLLFRDYLRVHPADAQEYAEAKRALAERFRNDREGYVHAKEPTVWSLLQRAHDWSQESGWSPGPSDG